MFHPVVFQMSWNTHALYRGQLSPASTPAVEDRIPRCSFRQYPSWNLWHRHRHREQSIIRMNVGVLVLSWITFTSLGVWSAAARVWYDSSCALGTHSATSTKLPRGWQVCYWWCTACHVCSNNSAREVWALYVWPAAIRALMTDTSPNYWCSLAVSLITVVSCCCVTLQAESRADFQYGCTDP